MPRKFENKVVVMDNGFKLDHDGTRGPESLDTLGNDGWQLVSVVKDQRLGAEGGFKVRYYFTREIEP